MENHEYKILSEDSIKYLCGLIRDLASVSEGIDNINLADDKTFSNIYIKNLIDKCLEDANAEAEKLVGALTHLTCEETVIQPTLDNSEINVIYLYSANGNPPYQQFLKINEYKLVDLGSTSISLEDYIKVADVAKDYATKVELKTVTDKIGTTTLTTTDTTITGAIEEVKGIAEGKAEILDSEKNDVNTWSSNKIVNEIAEVETELNTNLGELEKKVDKVDNIPVIYNQNTDILAYALTCPQEKRTLVRIYSANATNNPYGVSTDTDFIYEIDKINFDDLFITVRAKNVKDNREFINTKNEAKWSGWKEIATMDKYYIPIEANRTITFSNDYTEISVYRCGYSNIRAHIGIDAICNITSVGGWVQDMGIVLPEGYRPSENMSIPAWCSSDTEYHMPITLMVGTNGKVSGYIGGSHTSINRLNITVTYFK